MGRCFLFERIISKVCFFVFWLDTPGPQFRENSRERGRRSPPGRGQGLRPPWGPHTFARRSREAGRGCSPSGVGLRAAAHPQGGRLWHTGRRKAAFGGDAGAIRGRTPGRSRATGGESGQACRETAHSGRVSGGIRGAAPGRNRETGRRQGCIRGFGRGFRGAQRGQRGGNGGISGL